MRVSFADRCAGRSRYDCIMPLVANDCELSAHELLPPLRVDCHSADLLAVYEAVEILSLQPRKSIPLDQLLDLGEHCLAVRLFLAPQKGFCASRRAGQRVVPGPDRARLRICGVRAAGLGS